MEEVKNYKKSESGNLVASKDLSSGDIVLSLQPLAAGKREFKSCQARFTTQRYQKDL